jgi:hypothetical protein
MNACIIRGAVALSATATLAFATSAFAQDTTTTSTTTTQPVQAQPTTTVVQPAPQPQTNVTVAQPAPASTTQTTSGLVNPTAQREEQESGYAPNRYLLTSGLIVFGVPYLTSVVVASSSNHYGDSHLYVPLAGPWMDIADRGSSGNTDTETTNKVMLGVDGVFQAVGALQIIGALLMPETKTVTTATVPATAFTPEMHVTPAKMGYEGYGLAAFATF